MEEANYTIIFTVGDLLRKEIGTSQDIAFNGAVNLDGIITKSNLSGSVELLKIDEGINVVITDLKVSVEIECDRCLQKYSKEIKIPFFEAKYLYRNPQKIEDPNGINLIDLKHQKIELTELIRQEIILHFPLIAVCSKGCKGICSMCGIDKNHKKCDCKPIKITPEKHKPLAALKELLK